MALKNASNVYAGMARLAVTCFFSVIERNVFDMTEII